jgi:hypothetical protein
MIVQIEGSTETKRKHVEAAAYFFERLLFKRKLPSLRLNIELIHRLKYKEDTEGDCIWEDRPTKPREFTIRLDSSNNLADLIKTLAHEMVHVKQYALGELKDTSLVSVIWLGEDYNCEKVHYYDWPWEIEAAGRETGLYVRYMEKFEYTHEKWAKGFI